jgi:outer membrane protein OmpA-like peptidoglycan-associated protein
MIRKSLALILALISGLHLHSQVEFSFISSEKLSEKINSEFEETAPVFDRKGQILYFTRSLHPKNKGGTFGGQDIWLSQKTGLNWGEPSNDLKQVNNKVNNSVIGISTNGDTLYLLSTYEKKLSMQKGFSLCQNVNSQLDDPIKIDISGLNIKGEVYSGFVPYSGDFLVISMEGRNSLGQEDLYISIKESNVWSKPIWLGDKINSDGFEISPYLYDDGKTLIFASNGHGGFGDCDIFYSYRTDSSWTNWSDPVNMGEIVNSKGFDAFAFPANDVMYYASNKGDSFSNIYSAINESFYRIADTVRISFRMNTMKLKDVHIDVYDPEGRSVGRFESGHSDVVNVPDLKEGVDYTFTPTHDEVNLELFSPFVLNEHGEPISVTHIDEGSMDIIPQSRETNNAMEVIPPPPFVRGMSGIFELDNVPVRDVYVALTDKNGLPTQYSSTDEHGRFEFGETPDSIDLFIHTITKLEYVKQNGVVYYADSTGMKLFRAILDTTGIFNYQSLNAQELEQLKLLADEGTDNIDESTGIFKYNDLPRQGVKLFLVDENDNVIEEVTTDADGQFAFKKLQSDRGFQIRLSDEEDSDLSDNGQVLFLDSKGNELNVMTDAAGGAFAYKPLNAQLSLGMAEMSVADISFLKANYVFSIGLFKYQSLPKEGIILRLLDENDNVIETVTTDINGQFVFSSLKPDMNYRVQVVGLDDSDLEDSELYFVGNNGDVITALNEEEPKTYSFNKLNPDYFFSIKQLNERETELQITESFKDVSGQFKYQDLPKSGVKLYLLDENDKVIETVYTDEDGNFVFSQLAKESNFYVKLAEEDISLLDQSSFLLINEDDQELQQEIAASDGFSFKTLPRSAQGIANLSEDDMQGLNRFQRLTSGAFKFESLPKQGVSLVLLDENDNVIETVRTDADGHFFFSKMEEGKDYKVRVKGYNSNDIDKTQLYFINRNGRIVTAYNEDGTMTYAFEKLDAAYFNQVGTLSESETKLNLKRAFGNILGQYEYEGLPASGISLGLLDEHDKLLEVSTTNEQGGFAFTELANNSAFSVVVMDSSSIDHSKVNIKLSDSENQQISISEQEEHTFRFITNNTEVEMAPVDHMTGDGSAMMALAMNNGSGKNDLMVNVTKFHFNSVRLSDRDRYRINRSGIRQILSSNQPLLIVGYSCDIGDAEKRKGVAQQRADEVAKYLISLGVKEARIETATISDALSDVEYPTTDQRVENRKVEVYHLGL